MNPTTASAGPHHRVECLDLHAHLYRVTLTFSTSCDQAEISLPVWIPGSYMIREFSQHLQSLRARVGEQPIRVQQTFKNRWLLDGWNQPEASTTITVVYEVYALDTSVRTAWLDTQRGFFNGTSLLLNVKDQSDLPHHLTIAPPDAQRWNLKAPWHCATALEPVAIDTHGFGHYHAANYAALVDEPVEMGLFWSAHFEVRGIPHRLVVSGAPVGFDADRLLVDTRRICEAEMDFWHGPEAAPPFNRYVFLLNATHDGYGGLEHGHSTALICPRTDLPYPSPDGGPPPPLKATDGYTSLLGLIAHEYFHTWNVKRLRPAELAQPDLDTENPTGLLWWFEGFTSYYDDLLLLRAGLIDTTAYLGLLAKTLQQVAQTPGRHIHTVAQASYEAWTKYYRVQENTPNATVSYYTKGALVGLCLDLTLRQHGSSLDHAMRAAWNHTQGGPIDEITLRQVLTACAGRPLDAELDTWVHGTAELPVLDLLRQAHIPPTFEPAPLAQRLGLRVQDSQGISIRNVLRGGLGEQAGMAAGDEWLAIQTPDGQVWRLHKLDDLRSLLPTPQTVQVWVSRDRRIQCLHLSWPGHSPTNRTMNDTDFWNGQATIQFSGPSVEATCGAAGEGAWPQVHSQ